MNALDLPTNQNYSNKKPMDENDDTSWMRNQIAKL